MPKYWEQLAIEFEIDVDKCKVFVPLPLNCQFEESTPELHQAAIDKGLKYLELVGSLIYPACDTDLRTHKQPEKQLSRQLLSLKDW